MGLVTFAEVDRGCRDWHSNMWLVILASLQCCTVYPASRSRELPDDVDRGRAVTLKLIHVRRTFGWLVREK